MRIITHTPECACCRPLSSRKIFEAAMGYGEKSAYQRNAVQAMVRARRQIMIESQRELLTFLRGYFERQTTRVVAAAMRRASRADAALRHVKTSVDINPGAHREVWAQALAEVLGDSADVELINDYRPIIQRATHRSYSRTCVAVGEEEMPDAAAAVYSRANVLCRQVTRINDTTRTQMANMINDAVTNGETVVDVANLLSREFPDIAASRMPTIARTEVGRAVDEGTKQAIRESSVVAEVSVIGCTAVEPDGPTFDGRPTCNIVGVPAQRVDELIFHVNHSGTIVPSKFHE